MLKTLKDYRSIFLFNTESYKNLNLKDISNYINKNKNFTRLKSPEDTALDFYLLNHVMYYLNNTYSENQKIPQKIKIVMDHYIDRNLDIFVLSFLYLLSVSMKESRYIILDSSFSSNYEKETCDSSGFFDIKTFKGFKEEWISCLDFTLLLSSKNEQEEYKANDALLLNEIPNVTIETYYEFLYWLFSQSCLWKSGFNERSYGGLAWANIVRIPLSFIKGDISGETLIDTMWTLSHNSDIIFNKSVIFSHYESSLISILNAQSLGLIPDLILFEKETPEKKLYSNSKKSRKTLNIIKENIPEVINTSFNNYDDFMEYIDSNLSIYRL